MKIEEKKDPIFIILCVCVYKVERNEVVSESNDDLTKRRRPSDKSDSAFFSLSFFCFPFSFFCTFALFIEFQ